jgi:ankyrin repeat protein
MSWVRIFKGFLDERSVNAWRVMFKDDEYLESRTFPILHKIVLNLTTADLRQQLTLSTANINAQDSEGRTALAWAAARSDVAAVKTLLEFQADPNACCPRGQSALHLAAQNPSLQCTEVLRALLDAHADVNCVDYWRRSALLYAGCNQDDPPCLEHLIKAGADLNVRDIRERTPLGYACRMGKDRVARYLIKQGADLDIPDNWGLTPLLDTIEHHSHETLQCLLEHGADLTPTTNDGMTLLHHVALHGDAKTFCLLANQRLVNIDAAARDRSGRTAQDIFAQREEADGALTGAFQSLLDAVIQDQERIPTSVGDNGSESGASDDEGEDEFFDAVGHQTVVDG